MSIRLPGPLLLAAALLLGACQAPVTSQPSPAAAPEAWPYTALSPEGAFPADLNELDIVSFQAPVDAPLILPVTYRRGVEEEVSWEGTGQGAAELWNEHGQLIYRVREGEAPQTLMVSAGRYRLVITPDSGEPASAMLLLARPEADGAGLRRELLDLAETGPSARPPRGETDPCETASDTHERLRQLSRELNELRAQRDPDDVREKKVKWDYLVLRDYMADFRRRHADRLRAECDWVLVPY